MTWGISVEERTKVSAANAIPTPLRNVTRPLFARAHCAASDEEAGTLETEIAGRDIHFSPRTLIFAEGDLVDWVYQVTDGTVMLYMLLPDGRRQVVELLGPGDVFGFSPVPIHDCSAETLAATRCMAFDQASVERSRALMRRLADAHQA